MKNTYMYIVLKIIVREIQMRQRREMAWIVVQHGGQVRNRLPSDPALRQSDVP